MAIREYSEEKTFRVYVSECLRIMTKNMACQGKEYLAVKYPELIEVHKKNKDERTGDQIISDMKAKMAAMK